MSELVDSSGGQTEPVASVLAVMAKHLQELAERVLVAEKTEES